MKIKPIIICARVALTLTGCGNVAASNQGKMGRKQINTAIEANCGGYITIEYYDEYGDENNTEKKINANTYEYEGTFKADYIPDESKGEKPITVEIENATIRNEYEFSSKKDCTVSVYVNDEYLGKIKVHKSRYYLASGWYKDEDDDSPAFYETYWTEERINAE